MKLEIEVPLPVFTGGGPGSVPFPLVPSCRICVPMWIAKQQDIPSLMHTYTPYKSAN